MGPYKPCVKTKVAPQHNPPSQYNDPWAETSRVGSPIHSLLFLAEGGPVPLPLPYTCIYWSQIQLVNPVLTFFLETRCTCTWASQWTQSKRQHKKLADAASMTGGKTGWSNRFFTLLQALTIKSFQTFSLKCRIGRQLHNLDWGYSLPQH